MPKIFISYSSKDIELARAVFDSLTTKDFDCFFAATSIKPSENYAEAIIRALDSVDIVLLLYTKNSNVSPEVHKEIERASAKRIPIIPVRFENVPYHAVFEYHISAAQWIDAVRAKHDWVIEQIVNSVIPSLSLVKSTSSRVLIKRIGLGLLAIFVVFTAYLFIPSSKKMSFDSTGSDVKNESYKAHPAAISFPSATVAHDAKKIAILYFDNTAKSAELDVLRKGFADMLITDMNGKGGLSIIEREKLNEVLKEIKLQGSQSFDPASAVRIGKLLGVEYLVTGSFFEAFDQFRIDAKVIRVETGEVVTSIGATGTKNKFMQMENHLANDLIGNLGQVGTSLAPLHSAGITYAGLKDYSEVLDMIDQGKMDVASQKLRALIKANPSFEPAARLAKKINI